MATRMFSFRLEDGKRAAYTAAADGMALGDWFRSLADAAVDGVVPVKVRAAAPVEKQVPFNPAGPAVELVPVKERKRKKSAVPAAVIEIEAATVKQSAPVVPVQVAPAAPLKYTGAVDMFNGIQMYEVEREDGRTRWTRVAPPV